jgi:hypothetical protein
MHDGKLVHGVGKEKELIVFSLNQLRARSLPEYLRNQRFDKENGVVPRSKNQGAGPQIMVHGQQEFRGYLFEMIHTVAGPAQQPVLAQLLFHFTEVEGGDDGAAGDGGDNGNILHDAELFQAADDSQMKERRAKASAGKSQADVTFRRNG